MSVLTENSLRFVAIASRSDKCVSRIPVIVPHISPKFPPTSLAGNSTRAPISFETSQGVMSFRIPVADLRVAQV